jgi:hypothetical protein
MPLSYYIKNRIINYGEYENLHDEKQKQIQELLDNIYTCCINGNIGKDEYHYKKIHKTTTYPITTDIKFTDINGKYTNLEIQNKISDISGKKKGNLSQFLLYSYFIQKNSALIAFDDNDTIYTILIYYYNTEKDCIEVDAIWSDQTGGGGGIMMNFLINAIKCGISLCSNPSKYKRVLALYSIDDENTIDFYKKFSFIDNGQRKFTRELSVGSIDLNDADLDEERDIFYRELEENENNIIKLNDKLQFLNKDLQYLSNTTTIREIETTKNEIKDLRERQIQILDKLTELEESHIEFMSKFYSLLENKEILDKITFTERGYKKLDFGKLIKLINTIKETSDNDDFLKLVKQYLNKNKYYDGMEIARVLTGVFYEIKDEKKIIKNIKKLKKEKEESILTGKEGSGGSRRTRRRRRNKSNKRNKSKKKNH